MYKKLSNFLLLRFFNRILWWSMNLLIREKFIAAVPRLVWEMLGVIHIYISNTHCLFSEKVSLKNICQISYEKIGYQYALLALFNETSLSISASNYIGEHSSYPSSKVHNVLTKKVWSLFGVSYQWIFEAGIKKRHWKLNSIVVFVFLWNLVRVFPIIMLVSSLLYRSGLHLTQILCITLFLMILSK